MRGMEGMRMRDLARAQLLRLLLASMTLLAAACTGTIASPAGQATVGASEVAAPGLVAPADCPVTRPPEPPFLPPSPWPLQPPRTDAFWYGSAGLWTALPLSGSWPQLALGEKLWWWSERFDVSEDAAPDLTVTATRLDGDAPFFQAVEATNGYHESFGWAMLVGVEVASPGCWAFTGEYMGERLSFVVWAGP